jgi:hypothetical protein
MNTQQVAPYKLKQKKKHVVFSDQLKRVIYCEFSFPANAASNI